MENEIENSLVETIRSSELDDVAFDLADATLFQLPVLGTLSKLYGGVQSVHLYFYTKKVLAFLRELESIPREARQLQLDKMLAEPGEQEKFGEHLALLLDRMNEVSKAGMMGRVAKAFLEGKITRNDLKSLNFALDSIDLRMVDTLKKAVAASYGIKSVEGMMLSQCGLMTAQLAIETKTLEIESANLDGARLRPERYETFKSAAIEYHINRLGKLFVEVCLT